jgi:hypothetical protein
LWAAVLGICGCGAYSGLCLGSGFFVQQRLFILVVLGNDLFHMR